MRVYQSKQVAMNFILLQTGAVRSNKYFRGNIYVNFQTISNLSLKELSSHCD